MLLRLLTLWAICASVCIAIAIPTTNVRNDHIESSTEIQADAKTVPVLEHHANGQILGFRGQTNWKDDKALKLEAEREAGFVASSVTDEEIPLPDFWPLFKISVVSAIAIAILKVIRDMRR